jgi:hypothetical protein
MATLNRGDTASMLAVGFVAEVEAFRAAIADPSVDFAEKEHAWDRIVRHAALLDPDDPAFWRAGVALKDALCAWLDAQPSRATH